MQTLVYIIGGYCLIKAVLVEFTLLWALGENNGEVNWNHALKASGVTAFLFLTATEAFNQ